MVLQDWLSKRIFPFEDKLYPEAVYWSTMLAMAESLKFGIVSTSDMYYFCEDMARAVAGLRRQEQYIEVRRKSDGSGS